MLVPHRKRARDEAPRVAPAQRVPIDKLMESLKDDPTLQNALSSAQWSALDELHAQYRSGLARRTFVDSVGEIVGVYKLLGMVKELSTAQLRAPHPATLARVSSHGSASSGTPGTPGGAEIHRILRAKGACDTPRGPSEVYRSLRATRCGTPGGAEERGIHGECDERRQPCVQTATPELTPELSMLVHAWHCDGGSCHLTKCASLRTHLKRVDAHVDGCAVPTEECKTCKVWAAMQSLTPHRKADVAEGPA